MAAESLAKAGEITLVGSAQGCDLEGNATAASASRIAAAVALAKSADVPIVFVGLTPNNDPKNSGTPPVVGVASALESEGHDRTDIDLQGQQEPLIKALVAANPKTVVVLCARALWHLLATAASARAEVGECAGFTAVPWTSHGARRMPTPSL